MKLNPTTSVEQLFKWKLITHRGYTVCLRNQITNLDELLSCYRQRQNFLAFRNIGTKTNEDLVQLMKKYLATIDLIQQENKIFLPIYRSPIEIFFDFFHKIDNERKSIIETFFSTYKLSLSIRALNVFDTLSPDGSLNTVLTSFYNANFDLSGIKNLGQKTISEIETMFSNLFDIVKRSEDENIFNQIKEKNFNEQLERIIGPIDTEIELFLNRNNTLLMTGYYPLLDLFALLIRNSQIIKKKYHKIILNYGKIFINETKSEIDEVSSEVGLTKERIRQILLDQNIEKAVLSKLLAVLEILRGNGLLIPSELLLGDKNWYDSSYIKQGNNSNFSDFFLGKLMSLINPKYKYQELNILDRQRIFLIEESLSEKFDIHGFTSKINEIILSRIEEDFEINVQGFVIKFCRKNLSTNELNEITHIAKHILFDVFDLFYLNESVVLIRRNSRRKIADDIYDVIKAENKPLHVNEIVELLQLQGVYFEKQTVRSCLQRSEYFILMGGSIYGLKEWERDRAILGGTIKQLIEKVLDESHEPLHIYDIAKFILPQRNTNIKNIHGNLHIDPSNKFRFFGQNFYGLSTKNYDEDYDFKPVSNHWFKELKALFSKNETNKLAKSDILDYIATLYGVKRIQIEYLIDLRIEKGELIETNDKMLQLK